MTDRPLSEDRHYAFVRCQGDSVPGQQPCGLVGLTEMEYLRQLDKPDVGWWCPHCGSSADYDDAASEEAQGLNDEDEISSDQFDIQNEAYSD